jgi:hypothetical protein
MSISSSSLDRKDTSVDVEERNIESASSQIENQDILLCLALTIETVCDSRGGGFVDDAENIEACDGSCIFGSKALGIIEVGRNASSAVRLFDFM